MYCPNPDSMLTFLVVSSGKLPSLREKRIWAPKRERVPVPVLGVAVVTCIPNITSLLTILRARENTQRTKCHIFSCYSFGLFLTSGQLTESYAVIVHWFNISVQDCSQYTTTCFVHCICGVGLQLKSYNSGYPPLRNCKVSQRPMEKRYQVHLQTGVPSQNISHTQQTCSVLFPCLIKNGLSPS